MAHPPGLGEGPCGATSLRHPPPPEELTENRKHQASRWGLLSSCKTAQPAWGATVEATSNQAGTHGAERECRGPSVSWAASGAAATARARSPSRDVPVALACPRHPFQVPLF